MWECPESGELASVEQPEQPEGAVRFRCGCFDHHVDGFEQSANCRALVEGREQRRKNGGRPWPNQKGNRRW